MAGPRGSGSWKERQDKDPFVRRAKTEGYRARAVYKLEELDRRYKLLRRGMNVLDLGAAPGSWSQYVSRVLDGEAHIVAVDLLPMDALPQVDFIEGDFREDATLAAIRSRFAAGEADLVMSDMAPNISGNRAVDQPRAMYLVELAMEVCNDVLRKGGSFVCKLFQGEGADQFIADARRRFDVVRVVKPKASRAASREVYLVGTGFRPGPAACG